MKKFLYLCLFSFIFILFGISFVNASDLSLNDLGFGSCLDDNDNVVYTCSLDTSSGDPIYSPNKIISNYFLVSDGGVLSVSSASSFSSRICYYDKDFIFISCTSFSFDENNSYTLVLPDSAFYSRTLLNGNNRIYYISDDLNSLSSLNYAINSLTETVGNVFTGFTWVFLLTFSIVVIGFIIALILRVGK